MDRIIQKDMGSLVIFLYKLRKSIVEATHLNTKPMGIIVEFNRLYDSNNELGTT
jgi:hypothetical protein